MSDIEFDENEMYGGEDDDDVEEVDVDEEGEVMKKVKKLKVELLKNLVMTKKKVKAK